jgi:hypothetical protein
MLIFFPLNAWGRWDERGQHHTSRYGHKNDALLSCIRVGTAEIIYHDGYVNYGHEIIGFMVVCGCWRVELSCIAERVKWLIWCLARKGISGV